MSKKVRLQDVAKKARVSPSTASLVFSEKSNISDETRFKVIKTATELGYTKMKSVISSSNQKPDIFGLLLLLIQSGLGCRCSL